MVAVVSSNPTGGNFIFFNFKTLGVNIVQKYQICVENEKPGCPSTESASSVNSLELYTVCPIVAEDFLSILIVIVT